MISTLGILFGGTLVTFLAWIFSGLSFLIPQQILDSITYFLQGFGYFEYLFPIHTVFQALGIYLNFLVLFYLWKMMIWIAGFIPGTKNINALPALGEKSQMKFQTDRLGNSFWLK